MFVLSFIFTSLIGFLICYRSSKYFTILETLFISIFLGWGYFTNLLLFFSTNIPNIKLNSELLIYLIVLSLIIIGVPAIITHGNKLIIYIKLIPILLKHNINTITNINFCNIKAKYYLILPSVFLAVFILQNILMTIYLDIEEVDPIFEWVHRGELIFLESSVAGVNGHPLYFFPMQIPILYSWAYFFDFEEIRIFYLVALLGLIFITMDNVYMFTKSRYASLIFTIMIVYAQQYYFVTGYAEGLTNIYFFFALLYGLRYLHNNNVTYILLTSFFMTMYINTRSEGILYWSFLMLFIISVNVLENKFNYMHIIYWLLPIVFFNYLPNINFHNTSELKIVMHIKIITKCMLDMFDTFGDIYKNKAPYWSAIFPGEISLIRGYHGNKITCMIVSIFAFFDSLLFDPNKQHFNNVINTLYVLFKNIRYELYILLLIVLFRNIHSTNTIKNCLLLIVFPIVCFTVLINFLQIYIFYSPNTLLTVIGIAGVRYGGMITICILFFLSSNIITTRLFKYIDNHILLCYLLNIPFIYLILILPAYNYIK